MTVVMSHYDDDDDDDDDDGDDDDGIERLERFSLDCRKGLVLVLVLVLLRPLVG